jgi:hypothetical protein
MIIMEFTLRRTEVMSISEFMSKGREVNVVSAVSPMNSKMKTSAIVTGVSVMLTSRVTFAQESVPVISSKDVSQEIIQAFNPIIDLAQGISYPIAFLAITIACIMYMVNQKEKAISLIQNASLGYIFVHLAPMFMKVLSKVSDSI